MGVIEVAVVALALPISIWVTARATRALYSGDISESESRVPQWLEAMLPVKGRWLRYLMWGPVRRDVPKPIVDLDVPSCAGNQESSFWSVSQRSNCRSIRPRRRPVSLNKG